LERWVNKQTVSLYVPNVGHEHTVEQSLKDFCIFEFPQKNPGIDWALDILRIPTTQGLRVIQFETSQVHNFLCWSFFSQHMV
jgi:hypothetical protein